MDPVYKVFEQLLEDKYCFEEHTVKMRKVQNNVSYFQELKDEQIDIIQDFKADF